MPLVLFQVAMAQVVAVVAMVLGDISSSLISGKFSSSATSCAD